MENLPAAQPTTNQSSLASRAGWAVLIVATLYVCYFSHLGAIGFVGPDEPRYAWIARDMAETGDWVTPRLYGKPWFEKPPLFYWEAALSFKLFGVSEAAARLPSAVSALVATLTLAWLAWRMYGRETAHWLLLLLPTTVGMIGFSHAAATDMPFSAMLTIAMVFAAIVLGLAPNLNQPPSLASFTSFTSSTSFTSVFFGFFLGLAVLAKGPVGIVLCGGAVFFWALFTRRWRDAFRLLHPAAIVAFCATALPWYILCARRNPDFFRIFIIEHNFKRYLTPEFQHTQPFWYYLPILILALLPWTAIPLWSAISNAIDYYQSRKLDQCVLLLYTFAAFCSLFFSLSKSKLPGYILPVVPALSFTNGESIGTALSFSRKSLFFSLYGAGLFFFALGILASHALLPLRKIDAWQQSGVGALLLLLSVSSLSLACGLSARRPVWAPKVGLAFAVLWIVTPLYLVGGRYLSFIDHDNSARFLSAKIISKDLAAQVHTFGVNRSWAYGLNFYLRREVTEWDESIPVDSYVVTSLEGRLELQRRGLFVRTIEFGRSGKLRQNLSLYRVTVDKANVSTQ